MKFRPQRGGYEESMRSVAMVDPTYASLAKHLNVSTEDIEVDFYCHDTRDGWGDTFVVLVDGDVVGFTSGGVYV